LGRLSLSIESLKELEDPIVDLFDLSENLLECFKSSVNGLAGVIKSHKQLGSDHKTLMTGIMRKQAQLVDLYKDEKKSYVQTESDVRESLKKFRTSAGCPALFSEVLGGSKPSEQDEKETFYAQQVELASLRFCDLILPKADLDAGAFYAQKISLQIKFGKNKAQNYSGSTRRQPVKLAPLSGKLSSGPSLPKLSELLLLVTRRILPFSTMKELSPLWTRVGLLRRIILTATRSNPRVRRMILLHARGPDLILSQVLPILIIRTGLLRQL